MKPQETALAVQQGQVFRPKEKQDQRGQCWALGRGEGSRGQHRPGKYWKLRKGFNM